MIVFFSLVSFLALQCVSHSNAFHIPIATSSSINNVARSIHLAKSTIVVARNSTGHVVAFHDYCPHRGASFDKVVVEHDKIACPYHGFEFNVQNGNLTSGLGVKPGCFGLEVIDCVEKGGLLWVCVDGDYDIGPPEPIAEASDPSYRKICGSVIIKCPVEQLVANVVDSCHVSYVHSFGNKISPEPLSYQAQRISPTTGAATFRYHAGEGSMFNGVVDVFNWYRIPCTAGTLVKSCKNIKIVQVHAVQLRDNRTKVFWELYRNWATHPCMDIVFFMAMKKSLDEDKEILESCSFERGGFFHGRFDRLQILYYKALTKFKKYDYYEVANAKERENVEVKF